MKTRDIILKVAEEEFSKLGFNAVSMNNLVKKLDINKATIYYHFKDKKSLYNEVIKNAIERLNTNLRAVFDDKKDSNTLFRAYVNAIILTIKENPSIVPLALREFANYGANVDENFMPYINEEMNYLKMLVNKIDIKDEYKDMDIYSLYSFINGTIKTFYVIQMSTLPIGKENDLKNNSEKTLNYISEFVSNIILDAIVKK